MIETTSNEEGETTNNEEGGEDGEDYQQYPIPITVPAKCGKFLTILQNTYEGGGEGSVKSHFIKILLFDIILILISDILVFLEISTLFARR